jgi:hypothetical protein
MYVLHETCHVSLYNFWSGSILAPWIRTDTHVRFHLKWSLNLVSLIADLTGSTFLVTFPSAEFRKYSPHCPQVVQCDRRTEWVFNRRFTELWVPQNRIHALLRISNSVECLRSSHVRWLFCKPLIPRKADWKREGPDALAHKMAPCLASSLDSKGN